MLAQPTQSSTASDFVHQVIQQLPLWEADTLAQYEQPELAAVRRDLDEDPISEQQLTDDWAALEALDKALHKRYVV